MRWYILGVSLYTHWLMILKDRKSGQSITLFWAKYHHHTICIKFLGKLYLSQECCKRVKEFYTKFDFFFKKRKIQLIKWLLPIMEKQFMWHTTECKWQLCRTTFLSWDYQGNWSRKMKRDRKFYKIPSQASHWSYWKWPKTWFCWNNKERNFVVE